MELGSELEARKAELQKQSTSKAAPNKGSEAHSAK
jgi:hypothetical protein